MSTKKRFAKLYDINIIGEQRLVDLVLNDPAYSGMIKLYEDELAVSASKELLIKSELRSIREKFPDSSFALEKEMKNIFANELVEKRGYFSYIHFPSSTINELVEYSYQNDFVKSGKVNHSLSNQAFKKLDEAEKFDSVVEWLLIGGSTAAAESYLNQKLEELSRIRYEEKKVIKSKKNYKTNTSAEYNTLQDIFINKDAYEFVIRKLKEDFLIDESSCQWIDKTKGYRSNVVALFLHLWHNKYFRCTEYPKPYQIIHLAKNSFNVMLSERTIRSKHIYDLRKRFSFIKQFSPKS